MKIKPGKLLLSLLLALSMTASAWAASPADMTDIDGHWAYDAISYCMEQGLFNGVSSTEFSPNQSMTRGMFVTVLGRMAGVDETSFRSWYLPNLYLDVDAGAYYAPYVNWATRYGIVNGVGGRRFDPDTPVTREQMATIMVRYASIYNYQISSIGNESAWFTDADQISGYAVDAVESMRMTGILAGIPNGDGTVRFAPQNFATRAECATVFYRLSRALSPYWGRVIVEPYALAVTPSSGTLRVGDYTYLSAEIYPDSATNRTITWVSEDPDIAVVENGKVTAVGEGVTRIYAYTWNGLGGSNGGCCTITVEPAPYIPPDPGLGSAGESYEDKCMRIFGEYQSRSDYQYYYLDRGDEHITTISVRVWDFADYTRTTKITKTIYLQVHRNIAATVEAIFEEIYNGPEQFPIYAVGGYRGPEVSEHGLGVALDINPNENYQCANDGTAWTGSYWRPGEDEYSIPVGGDVETAFRKYGFGWGGTDWRSSHDYMHFSYFGW